MYSIQQDRTCPLVYVDHFLFVYARHNNNRVIFMLCSTILCLIVRKQMLLTIGHMMPSLYASSVIDRENYKRPLDKSKLKGEKEIFGRVYISQQ